MVSGKGLPYVSGSRRQIAAPEMASVPIRIYGSPAKYFPEGKRNNNYIIISPIIIIIIGHLKIMCSFKLWGLQDKIHIIIMQQERVMIRFREYKIITITITIKSRNFPLG